MRVLLKYLGNSWTFVIAGVMYSNANWQATIVEHCIGFSSSGPLFEIRQDWPKIMLGDVEFPDPFGSDMPEWVTMTFDTDQGQHVYVAYDQAERPKGAKIVWIDKPRALNVDNVPCPAANDYKPDPDFKLVPLSDEELERRLGYNPRPNHRRGR